MGRSIRSVVCLVLICLGLVGLASCSGNTPDGAENTATRSAQSGVDIEKYNAYIAASNQLSSATLFAEGHDHLSQIMDGSVAVGSLRWHHGQIERFRKRLDEAVNQPGAVPSLDDASKALLEAVNNMQTLSAALTYYEDTRAHLEDIDGEKFKEIAVPFLPLLAVVADAQAVFDDALEKEDTARLLADMEQAKEGSFQKYSLTSIYYAKRIASGLVEAFEARLEGQDVTGMLEPVKTDIAEFDSNAQGYSAHVAEHRQFPGGDCIGSYQKAFLFGVRTMIQELQEAIPPPHGPNPQIRQMNEEHRLRRERDRFNTNVERTLSDLIDHYNRC